MTYSIVIVAGNVGRDCEMRYTPQGQAVAQFSVAQNHKYTKADGQKVEEVTWFHVAAWGKLAEICNQYVKKGMTVLVEGHLKPDKATGGPHVYTRQDGTPGANFDLQADNVRFLWHKNSDGMNQDTGAEKFDQTPAVDDIPF